MVKSVAVGVKVEVAFPVAKLNSCPFLNTAVKGFVAHWAETDDTRARAKKKLAIMTNAAIEA